MGVVGNLATLLQNREHGASVERWVADELLGRVHEQRRVVGGLHGGAVPECNAYDVDGDGLAYEVKDCLERVARQAVASGTQPGRWKIDTWNHHGLDEALKARAMYGLTVSDALGPKRAYLVSHRKMTQMLAGYARQGRFVSLTTSVWEPRLFRIWSRRRAASPVRSISTESPRKGFRGRDDSLGASEIYDTPGAQHAPDVSPDVPAVRDDDDTRSLEAPRLPRPMRTAEEW